MTHLFDPQLSLEHCHQNNINNDDKNVSKIVCIVKYVINYVKHNVQIIANIIKFISKA